MIPKTWDNVTVENYVALQRSLKKEGNPFDLIIERVCYITGKSVEEVKKKKNLIKLASINRLLNKPLPKRRLTHFRLNGVRYRAINASDITADRYTSIMDCSKRDSLTYLHQVMFLVSTPQKFGFKSKFPFIGWKDYEFSPSEVPTRIEEFKKLPMKVAYPNSVFFCELSKRFKTLIQDYSDKQMEKLIKMGEALLQDLEIDTDG